MKNKLHSSCYGFTLVELLVTMAIVAILITIAIPAFQETIRQNRLSTSAANIVASFNIARSEAIRRGRSVSICSSQNSTACRLSASAADWSDGWIIFTDLNANGVFNDDDTTPCEDDGDDCILQIRGALPGGVYIT